MTTTRTADPATVEAAFTAQHFAVKHWPGETGRFALRVDFEIEVHMIRELAATYGWETRESDRNPAFFDIFPADDDTDCWS